MSVNYNHVFMTFIFFIGLILTVFSWRVDTDATLNKCNSEELRLLNKITLSIGISFITSSASFFICSYSCNYSNSQGYSLYVYMLAMFLLGVGIIVTSALTLTTANCPAISSDVNIILGLGILITSISLFYFIISVKKSLISVKKF